MNYTVIVSTHAQRAFRKLSAEIQQRVTAALLRLEVNARPPGCLKLEGRLNQWRIRVGRYRVIYQIDDAARRLYILEIGPRRDIYEE